MKGLDKAYIQCDFVFCRFQYLQQTDHNIAEADKHSGQKQTPLKIFSRYNKENFFELEHGENQAFFDG